MKSLPSILRRAEHEALSHLTLNGRVLDLGGEKGAEYLSYIQGTFAATAVNIDTTVHPDIVHDLEQPLPVEDASFDHVLLINVLEHVFEYRDLLEEAVRVVAPGGSLVVIVPFLFPIHPSPSDYHRFTAETLRREFARLGLSDIRIQPLGSGVFAVRYLMLDRLLPYPLRFIGNYTFRHLARVADAAFAGLARSLGKKYAPEEYPLGYLATAIR